MLITAFEEDAKRQGFTSFNLGIWKDNPANRFYQRIGYQFSFFKDGYNYSKRNRQVESPGTMNMIV
jgi:ribosomal protein S18 acetylase RimI-like enzyme